MDCRKALVLAVSLLGGGLGCVGTGPQAPPLPPPPGTQHPTVAKEGPPRTPKAATCVAFGTFREREAADPKKTPAERLAMLEQARKAYQQALEIDAKHLPAYQGLARIYLALNDSEQAQATYRKAVKKFPKEASLWYDQGMYSARLKKWDAALESLREAVKLEPEDRTYVKALGFLLARVGRRDESVACLAKVEGQAMAQYEVARMMLHLKQTDLCKMHLQLALQAKPDLEAAQQLLARLEERSRTTVTVGFEEREPTPPGDYRGQ
jgi:tetratricopeptide (TPR) repeat protein